MIAKRLVANSLRCLLLTAAGACFTACESARRYERSIEFRSPSGDRIIMQGETLLIGGVPHRFEDCSTAESFCRKAEPGFHFVFSRQCGRGDWMPAAPHPLKWVVGFP